MSDIFRKQYNVNLPKSAHAEAEFGPGKAGIQMCENCKAVYYKKHWHRNLEALNNSEMKNVSEHDTGVKFILCPACAMIKNGQYEGRVRINAVPADKVVELEGLIAGFCRRAQERDPMHRLIAIKKTGVDWEVTVTENQLANKLANKICETSHVEKKKTMFASEPSDVAYITIEFLQNGETTK